MQAEKYVATPKWLAQPAPVRNPSSGFSTRSFAGIKCPQKLASPTGRRKHLKTIENALIRMGEQRETHGLNRAGHKVARFRTRIQTEFMEEV